MIHGGGASESLYVDGVEDVVEVVGEEEFVVSEPAIEGELELVDIVATALITMYHSLIHFPPCHNLQHQVSNI
jgi:hypothetical protein